MGKTKRTVIADIEANSLTPTKIWCIVCKDIDTGEIFKFRPKGPLSGHDDFKDEFIKFVDEVGTWIGHNFLAYDVWWINKLLGTNIHYAQVIDTLVLSRLYRPVSPFKEQMRRMSTDNRLGGHSLEAWGLRLGHPKTVFNDWSQFTEEMLEYCVDDVELNHLVYDKLLLEGKGFSTRCIRLEHKVAWLLAQQERNGFYLDQDCAKELLKASTTILDEMYVKLQDIFPPVPKLVREFEVRYNKDKTMGAVSARILEQYRTQPNLRIEAVSGKMETYNLFALETFNPKSSKQIAERLLSIGWNPRKFTPKGNPATDKDTLAEAIEILLIENPDLTELKYLGNYNIVADRQQKASKWLELVEEDGRVHGRINPIGAGTHRCSHYNDNMANIARVIIDGKGNPLKGLEGKYGWESRACWSAPNSDLCIVGADASGIQLRALAHYMNDPKYTKALLETDIHVVNGFAAGIIPMGASEAVIKKFRPKAKTFIYAWLLGAGDEKIGTLVGVTPEEYEELFAFARKRKIWGKPMLEYIMYSLRKKKRKATQKLVATIIKGFRVKEQFLNRTPALKRLKQEEIPDAAKQGFLIGIDGRKLWIPSEHLAMSLYLQGFEAVIMKAAMCFYHDDLHAQGIEFKQCAFVHDEWCIETRIEHGDAVGQACVRAIKKAGEIFESNCPLDGDYLVGRTWANVH